MDSREKAKGKRQKAKPQGNTQNRYWYTFEFWVVVLPFAFYLLSYCLVFPAVVFACPGCKEALFDPRELPQRLATARGYALSIGLMLAMPLGLVGGLGAAIIRSSRRFRARSPRKPW